MFTSNHQISTFIQEKQYIHTAPNSNIPTKKIVFGMLLVNKDSVKCSRGVYYPTMRHMENIEPPPPLYARITDASDAMRMLCRIIPCIANSMIHINRFNTSR